jgi:hypothetical protein
MAARLSLAIARLNWNLNTNILPTSHHPNTEEILSHRTPDFFQKAAICVTRGCHSRHRCLLLFTP